MTEYFPSGGEDIPEDVQQEPQRPEPMYLDDRHMAFLSDPSMLSVPLDRGFQDIERSGTVDPDRVPHRLRMVPIVDRTGRYTPHRICSTTHNKSRGNAEYWCRDSRDKF